MCIAPQTISRDLKENTVICDMLISMTYAAANSSRKMDIFEPFPFSHIVGENRDYDGVARILDLLPSVSDMLKHCDSEKDLKKYLGEREYKMLEWILAYKRVAMFKLEKEKQIKEML